MGMPKRSQSNIFPSSASAAAARAAASPRRTGIAAVRQLCWPVALAALNPGATLGAAGRRGRTYLPADQCAIKGVDQEDILRGKPSEGLAEVTQAVAAAAKVGQQAGRRGN